MTLKAVWTAPNEAVAEMVRGILAGEGITALVKAVGLAPYIGPGPAVILVPSEREEEARRVIEAYLAATDDPAGAPG